MTIGPQIVGIATRCAVGLTTAAAAAAVGAGVIRVQAHPFMVDEEGEPIRGALEPSIDPELLGTARIVELGRRGLKSLIDVLPLVGKAGHAIPVLLALPEYRPGFDKHDEANVIAGLRQPSLSIQKVAHGHAGALHGLVVAKHMIESRQAQLVIVGGVDSYFQGDTIDWLMDTKQLQSGQTRSGFFPGEASGFVAVVEDKISRSLAGVSRLATIRGGHSETELALINTDAVNRAEALTKAMAHATAGLRPPLEVCDSIVCDINGQRYRNDEWSTTQLRLTKVFRYEPGKPASYEAPARSWGDVGAASGVLFCALASEAWRRPSSAGPRTLLFAGSDRGLRSAVVLEQPAAGGR